MSDQAFGNELWIYCYKTQIDGYPLGHPCRAHFEPIVPYKKSADGTYDRRATLEMAVYSGLSVEDRALLLEAER